MLEAQLRKKRNITDISGEDFTLYLRSERGVIRLLPVMENVLRVSYSETGDFEDPASCFARDVAEHLHPPVYRGSFKHHTQDGKLILGLPGLKAEVNLSTGSVSYFGTGDEPIAKEADFESKVVDPFESFIAVEDDSALVEELQTADGVKRRILSAARESRGILCHTRLSLEFAEEEVLFGLGQSPEGCWNLRGTTQYLHQANLKSPIPILLSDRGYGIFLSSQSTCIFEDSEKGGCLETHADPFLDYYFIAGGVREVVAAMRTMSGKASMLPRWAFGYIQSQERYESQKEILDTAKKFRELDFPVSAIVQDWLSWPEGLWGQKSFDATRYPEPKAMIEELHRQGIHFVISIWPNMGEGGSNFREFRKNGAFLPNSHLYNALSPEGRALYWKQVSEGLFSKGVDGWWGDSCEPVTPEWEHVNVMGPAFVYHEFVEAASKILPEEKLNVFCAYHSRTLYEGQRAENADKRVFNLTRSGFPGSQAMGAVVWSGDISASWDTLRRQVSAGLSFVTTGMPYWNLDIGAFFVKRGEPWYWNGDYDEPVGNPDYLELYLRWFQYGMYLPVMRAHGTDLRREPWNLARPGSEEYEILKSTARMRYRLQPYIYSLAGAVWLRDELIMRPLLYDFPKDRVAPGIGDQFMFGPSIMVCPVTEPERVSGGRKTVYLPAGCDWFDLHTHRKYHGGCHVTVELTREYIPAFVPTGAILPMDEDGMLTILAFKGRKGSFLFYEDAGDGYGYEDGEYALTEITYDGEELLSFRVLHTYEGARDIRTESTAQFIDGTLR
jgi:alpha-D-xyloside xylohydrolase